MSKDSQKAINAADYKKYSNPIPSREYIMGLLDEPGKTLDRDQLGKLLQLSSSDDQESLRRRLRAMELSVQPKKWL